MRGRLFQSADEETEPQGGEAPRLRSHSELVSEPAQGPASCSNPHLPRPSSAPATPSSCPCAASSHRALALPGPSWLCSHSPCCLCLLQGPLPRRLCAGPRAPSACEMRPWQVGSGGNSAPDSQWGEALNHSALGTPPGSDSDSAGRAPRPVPVAKVRNRGPCLPRSPTSVSPAPLQTLLGLCSFTRCLSTPCGSITSLGRGLPSCSQCLPTSPACLCPGPCGPVAALCPARIGRGMGWLHRDPGGT